MATAVIDNRPQSAATPDRGSEKFLSFELRGEEFAIRVLSVREIMGMQSITAVPQMPPFVKGIINLRGKVVPIIDLRLKFTMPVAEYTQRTCIIVVEVPGDNGRKLMGIVVDAMSEVLNLSPADIEDTPDFGEGLSIPYIFGIAKNKGKVKILLDIDRVLSNAELCELNNLLH
jgi:purine-binding chemotaxis protein CheW